MTSAGGDARAAARVGLIERLCDNPEDAMAESARSVSDELKSQHPEIPWRLMVAQRNVLAHDYGEIMQDRIWRVAVERVPELTQQLSGLLPAVDDDH